MKANQANFAYAPAYDAKLSQYHTPPKLAASMAELLPNSNQKSISILEPSAGGGNLVRAALDARRCEVTMVEVDPQWSAHLRKRFELLHAKVNLHVEDFLEWQAPKHYDAVLMNPPLDGGVGVNHVARALEMAGVVITVLRGQDLHGVKRYQDFWSAHGLYVDYLVFCPQRPFKGALSDFVVVRFDGRLDRPTELAWWR